MAKELTEEDYDKLVAEGEGVWCEDCSDYVDGMEVTEYGTCEACQSEYPVEEEE